MNLCICEDHKAELQEKSTESLAKEFQRQIILERDLVKIMELHDDLVGSIGLLFDLHSNEVGAWNIARIGFEKYLTRTKAIIEILSQELESRGKQCKTTD